MSKLLDGTGLEKVFELVKSQGGLPTPPSSAGSYQLFVDVDSQGESTLAWKSVSTVWQYPLQTLNNLRLYQGFINQYNNNLQIT